MALAFRELEDCLKVNELAIRHLTADPSLTFLLSTKILDRREVANSCTEEDAPPTLVHYLCQAPHSHGEHSMHMHSNGFASAPRDGLQHYSHQWLQRAPAADHYEPDSNTFVAHSLADLVSRNGAATWVVETALPLAYIKYAQELVRGGDEYAGIDGDVDSDDWMYGAGQSSGGHQHTSAMPYWPALSAAKSNDSGTADALASRRSRRNVGRKVYYDDEDADLDAAMHARLDSVGATGATSTSERASRRAAATAASAISAEAAQWQEWPDSAAPASSAGDASTSGRGRARSASKGVLSTLCSP